MPPLFLLRCDRNHFSFFCCYDRMIEKNERGRIMEEKISSIIEILKARYPEAPCALHFSKDYELMIAVRLSAQCTDARVNLVTPALFQAYPTLESIADAMASSVG